MGGRGGDTRTKYVHDVELTFVGGGKKLLRILVGKKNGDSAPKKLTLAAR